MILSSMMLVAMAPLGDPGAWISSDDYPIDALRNGVEGDVAVRLEIGQQGVPTACSVIASSGSASLDGATCRLLIDRARFQPTQKPEKIYYQTRIQWKIPETPLNPIALQGFTAFSNFKDGKPVGDCVEEVIGKPIELLPFCEIMTSPNDLSKLGLNNLPQFSSLKLRLLLIPKGELPKGRSSFDQTAQQHVLLKANFEIQADGSATNCNVVENKRSTALGEVCSAIESGETKFDTSGAGPYPVAITFVLDALTK